MTVRERYENALAEMRFWIREARGCTTGKELGDLLVEQVGADGWQGGGG